MLGVDLSNNVLYYKGVDRTKERNKMTDLQKHYLKNIHIQNYILREETNHPDFNRNLEIKNLKAYCRLLKQELA